MRTLIDKIQGLETAEARKFQMALLDHSEVARRVGITIDSANPLTAVIEILSKLRYQVEATADAAPDLDPLADRPGSV